MEQWAEIRRLHKAEGVLIKEISRRLGIARNTVRSALASTEPPKYQRAERGSIVDSYEPEIRKLLREYPRMPATVIAERTDWKNSISTLKNRIAKIRPEYTSVDPVDRLVHEPGQAAQMDLWFPEPRIPVGFGQSMMLPVLVMTLSYSRVFNALMVPSRQGPDLTAGMWSLINNVGAVPKTLIWDRESAVGGKGKVTEIAAAFAGTLATRIILAHHGILNSKAKQYATTSSWKPPSCQDGSSPPRRISTSSSLDGCRKPMAARSARSRADPSTGSRRICGR